MYRMMVLKSGFKKSHDSMMHIVGDQRFQITICPLEASGCIERVKQYKPDLLVVDMCTNQQWGVDLLREVRILGIHTEVLVYIERNDCEILKQIMRFGVVDCLVDPFDTDRIDQAVERFLHRSQILERGGHLSQQQIDGIIKGVQCKTAELPKGLQKQTLNTIRSVFNRRPQCCFSCEDIVSKVKLSRITVKRYLAYLQQNNELLEDINYQTGGRPCSLYQYNPGLLA